MKRNKKSKKNGNYNTAIVASAIVIGGWIFILTTFPVSSQGGTSHIVTGKVLLLHRSSCQVRLQQKKNETIRLF